MRKFMKAAGLTMAVAALATASASATTGPAMLQSTSPIGTASNIPATSGSGGAGLSALTFTATSNNISCSIVVLRVTSVSTTTAAIDPSYTSCTYNVSGTPLAGATFDTNCAWDLGFANATFNSTTAASAGGTVNICTSQITIPALGCTLDLFSQTREGISTQNVDINGNASTAATPWGSKINSNVSGVTYTTTGSCPGFAEHGSDSAYTTTVAVENVWASL
jgi:hypothetical protein